MLSQNIGSSSPVSSILTGHSSPGSQTRGLSQHVLEMLVTEPRTLYMQSMFYTIELCLPDPNLFDYKEIPVNLAKSFLY